NLANTYWHFHGTHADALFNGNSATSVAQKPANGYNAVHMAAAIPPNPENTVTADGVTMTTSEESDDAYFFAGVRFLPSRLVANVLGDAYGYTVVDPASFGTFYAVLNNSTGDLLVRGRLDAASADTVTLDTFSGLGSNFVSTSVSLGTPVPGTAYMGAYTQSFFGFQVSSITIRTNDSGAFPVSSVNLLRTPA